MHKIKNKILSLINKGDSRSVLLKKNVIVSFLLKAIGMGIGYIRFPLTLSYLGNMWYGVWLTIGSFTGWLSFFNLGLGNGLRNKLAESLANGDVEKSKKYVSSTYFVISIISLSLFLILMPVILFIDWNPVFNIQGEDPGLIRGALLIFVGLFCLKFILSIIESIFDADQRPAYGDLVDFLTSTLFFIGIIFLINFTEPLLMYIVIVHGGLPVLIFACLSVYWYRKRYKNIRPSFKSIDKTLFRDLASLGLRFFIIQMSVIILFASDNMIISHVLGPEDVVPYNAARKYFSIVAVVFYIILEPFWSAFTNAYIKGDLKWVKTSIKKLMLLVAGVLLALIVMLLISPMVFKIWLKDMVEIPWELSLLMALFVFVRAWGNVFIYYINGVGKITLQLYIAVITGVINIPLSIYLAKNLEMGINGIILATIICLGIGAIIYPIQYLKIIRGNAKGIWNR
ncbi:lipopolysaccharide biosynthesis protein [Carboxylicivirga sp. M1479]|uniref:lipopolysaccharide biosynthesis protein n=1 Tax=Carboxylicivirga sp. M1479 TaxID=2594476 RepID=UPI0011787615|nr:oligosaccharide flippase family protein [Carboxylicivirga sp. M1479]TRX66357.1 oligosaccharide flippase family protein [Carboxylicivirga sp. M1479]